MEFVFLGRRQFEHGISEDTFTNAPQPSGPQFILNCLIDHKVKHLIFNTQLDPFQFEEFFILANQGVFRLRQDGTQRTIRSSAACPQ